MENFTFELLHDFKIVKIQWEGKTSHSDIIAMWEHVRTELPIPKEWTKFLFNHEKVILHELPNQYNPIIDYYLSKPEFFKFLKSAIVVYDPNNTAKLTYAEAITHGTTIKTFSSEEVAMKWLKAQ